MEAAPVQVGASLAAALLEHDHRSGVQWEEVAGGAPKPRGRLFPSQVVAGVRVP